MLYDTALLIQKADFASPGAQPVMAQLEELLSYFESHAHHEDHHILPAIQKFDAALVDDFEQQHVEDHRLGAELNRLIRNWKGEPRGDEMRAIGAQLFYTFNEFIAFNLYHMNKEEDLLNAVLWKNYSDPELMQITQRIVADIKPEILLAQSRWMMRSINHQERVAWLSGLKASAPAPVLALFTRMAQDELTLAEWMELKTQVFEDAVMA